MRLRSSLNVARVSLEAVRLIAHGTEPDTPGSDAIARAAARYDEVRRLLDVIDSELAAVERSQRWKLS